MNPYYEAQTTYNGARPTEITLRLVHPGGANVQDWQIYLAVADTLRQAVIRSVRLFRPMWTAPFINNQARGKPLLIQAMSVLKIWLWVVLS